MNSRSAASHVERSHVRAYRVAPRPVHLLRAVLRLRGSDSCRIAQSIVRLPVQGDTREFNLLFVLSSVRICGHENFGQGLVRIIPFSLTFPENTDPQPTVPIRRSESAMRLTYERVAYDAGTPSNDPQFGRESLPRFR